MKTQLDNIEAILLTGDADTCLPVIANQAETMKAHGPAALKGISKGVLKAANPVNMATGLYYMVNGASRGAAFILIESVRFQCYTVLALTNPTCAFLFALILKNK